MDARKVITNVNYDELPRHTRKKFRKYFDQQAAKHPKLSKQEILDKLGKKFKVKFEFE